MKVLAVGLALLLMWNVNAAEDTAPAPAAPAAPAADPKKSEGHQNKARVLIDQKDWKGAFDESRLATESNPQSLEAWLIHGTVAMRLEKNREALDAFNKYLALNPPADKAAAVKLRVAELEIRVNKDIKAEQDKAAAEAKAKAERFGPRGAGFFFAYSPSYKPKITGSDDLHTDMSSSYDFGFKIKMFDVGFRMGSGTVTDNFVVKNDKDVVLRTETNDGKYSMWELFMRWNIPVKQPEEGKAGIEWAIPVHFGIFNNSVTFSKKYWNMGMNVGSGLLMRYYTNNHFVFDVAGLYHLSAPLNEIRNNDADFETLYNSKGKKIAGNMSGFELRAGITILF